MNFKQNLQPDLKQIRSFWKKVEYSNGVLRPSQECLLYRCGQFMDGTGNRSTHKKPSSKLTKLNFHSQGYGYARVGSEP